MNHNKAFTLVELLTVIVIITILASISLFALTGSYEEAKIVKTRGTIQKLDVALQTIFESYEEKFDAITINRQKLATALNRSVTDADLAIAKLHFIRDIMRMEMPQSWAEVNYTNGIAADPKSFPIPIRETNVAASKAYSIDPPAVLSYYRSASAFSSTNPLNDPAAELLYLIIANLNPEALENFRGAEIGDLDGNGLLEFHDAWGRPIRFYRTVPAFEGSDRQPNILADANRLGNAGFVYGVGSADNSLLWANGPNAVLATDWATISTKEWSTLTTPVEKRTKAYIQANESHPDPFDEKHVARSWFLYPLIISAGPDGLFDINGQEPPIPPTSGGAATNCVSWTATDRDEKVPPIYMQMAQPTGMPGDYDSPTNPSGSHGSAGHVCDRNNALNHYDNIHNHRQSGGF